MTVENNNLIFSLTQEFAGLKTPIRFDREATESLLNFHREIAEQQNLVKPYFSYTDTGEDLLLEMNVGDCGDLSIKAGPIGAFSSEDVAIFIQGQTRNYVDKRTMGVGFPRGNTEAEKELLGVFIDGFDPQDLLISVYQNGSPNKCIIGGARLVHGDSSISIGSSASHNDSDGRLQNLSTLPTFYALKILNKLDNEIADVSEKEAVCITRYWREEDFALAALDVNNNTFTVDTIALMPLVMKSFSVARNKSDMPKFSFFDIHIRNIAEFVKRNFSATLLGQGSEQLVASREILNTVLKYHYGGKEIGGYIDSITLGCFVNENFLQASIRYLRKRGIERLSFTDNGMGGILQEPASQLSYGS